MRTLGGGGRGPRAKLSAACGGLMRRAGCWQAVVPRRPARPAARRARFGAGGLGGRREGQKRRAARDGLHRGPHDHRGLRAAAAAPPRDAGGTAAAGGSRPRRFGVHAAAVLRRRSDAPGDVGTLVGVDATKLMEASLELHLVGGAAAPDRHRVRVVSFFCRRRRAAVAAGIVCLVA